MPRREPLNEKIIRALASRQEHFRALNSGEHFAYGRAIDIVRRHHGNITNPATQLKKYKDITNRIFGVIIKVCNGEAPEEMPPPTPRQLQQAAARGPLLWHNPPPVGAGSWAILITLYRRTDASMPRGPPYLTKNQIIAMAVEEVGVNLDDSTRGFSKWKGVDTCENKKWIIRDRRSRQFGARNGGQWGGAKDTFRLTEEGKQLANILSQQEQASRQPGQRRPGAAAAMSAGAAAAQRYDEELGEGGDVEEGPEPFRPYAAAGGAAAGAGAPVFTGRGQLLGGSPAPAARRTSAAAAGAGRARHRGPTEANRGGIFGAWDDDIDGLFCPADDAGYESDTPPAAAAAASRRRSTADAAATAMPARRPSAAAAAAAAGSPAARRRLLPRVKASERPLPLCADGKCEQCDTLRTFRDGQMEIMHIANLSKAKQQHVKQVASWLAAPEGGGNLLSVTDGPGKALVLHRRAPADSRPISQEPGHAAGGAATGGAGGNPDPLGELSKLLSQRQSAPARTNPPAAPATTAAAAAADVARDFASLQADLFGPAAAAAASRGLLDGLGGDHMLGFTAAAAAAAAAAGGGRAGNADADEDWLLDSEDIQEQAALLEAAAAARRQSQPAPTQQQQQQQAPAAAASDDGLTPAMRAAAAAEARMRQQQSHQPPRSAGPAAGKPQQQPQPQQQQQQQGRVPEPVVIADTQLEEQLLAETEDLDAWLAQQQQQQQDMPRQRRRQQQQPTNAHNGTAAGSAAAAAAAAPCIVLLESQDVAMGSADDPAAAAARSRSAEVVGRSRKRQQPDGPSPLQVVLLDSQDEELAAAGVTGCHSGVTAAGPPRHEPTSRMNVEGDHAPAKRRRRQQPQHQLEEEEDGSLQSSQQQRQEEGGAGVAGRAATARPCIEILDTQVELWDLPNDDLAAAAGGGVGAAAGTSGVSAADRYGAGAAARQPSAAGAAAAAGGLAGSRAASPAADAARRTDRRQRQSAAADAAAFELKLVVDEKERIQNPDPNHIYSSLRREHLAALHSGVMPDSVTVDVDRDDLPLGDYMWLVLPQDQQEPSAAAGSSSGRQSRGRGGGDGGASDGHAGAEEDEETAAAAERTRCLVAGAVVERKTVRDLVSRSAKSDHLRQLQRMHYLADVLPHQLLIIENVTQLANHYVTYGALPGAAPGSSTVIDNEASLFDFIIRAAVSEYGDVQRILLAPSTADSRDILLAVTQLLLYEQQQQQRRRQQQRQRRLSDANEAHGGEGLTYRELKTLCHQVSRRLPRSAVDPLMGALPPGDPRPPDAAFTITRGAGGHSGLVLYHHKTYQGLRVVYLEGHSLLKLLNEFYTTATADIHSSAEAAAAGSTAGLVDGLPAAAAAAGTAAAAAPSLTVNEAVTAATEVAAMLASYLQSFLEAAGITSSNAHRSSQQRQQHTRPCCMLMAENLVGPRGAVVHMHRVQQQACLNPGRQAATKAAAARQQEAMSLSAPAITQWLWLWLVVFVFQHDWHLHLAQSSTSVRTFLEAAGSRCAWLAEQLQEQQQGEEEVGVFGSYRLQQQQQEEVGNGRLGQRQSQQQQQRGLSAAAAAGAAERGSGSDKGASFSLLGDDDTNAGDEQVWGQAEDAAWASHRKQHAAQPQRQPGLPPGLSRGRSQKHKGHCSLLGGISDGADSGDGFEQRGVEEDGQEVEEWLSQRQKQRQQQQQRQPSRKSTGSDFMSWLEEEQGMGAQQQQQQQQLVGAAAIGSGGTAAAAGRVVRSAHGQNGVGDADVIPDSEDDDDVIIVD